MNQQSAVAPSNIIQSLIIESRGHPLNIHSTMSRFSVFGHSLCNKRNVLYMADIYAKYLGSLKTWY